MLYSAGIEADRPSRTESSSRLADNSRSFSSRTFEGRSVAPVHPFPGHGGRPISRPSSDESRLVMDEGQNEEEDDFRGPSRGGQHGRSDEFGSLEFPIRSVDVAPSSPRYRESVPSFEYPQGIHLFYFSSSFPFLKISPFMSIKLHNSSSHHFFC